MFMSLLRKKYIGQNFVIWFTEYFTLVYRVFYTGLVYTVFWFSVISVKAYSIQAPVLSGHNIFLEYFEVGGIL